MKRLTFSCLLLFTLSAEAELKLPAVFSDHAVLQRERTVPVWGWATPGQEVTVTLAEQSAKAQAGANGKWRVDLPAVTAKGPLTLTVTAGAESKTVNDVLIGEVWLGSGQSNMAMTVNRAKDYEQEQTAANLPQIRMFTERGGAAPTPRDRPSGEWVVCAPETVGGFSATAYFFGRQLHKSLGVPVGLINSSVGGTPIESWIAAEAQRAEPSLEGFFAAVKKADAEFDPVAAKALYEKQLARWREAARKAKAEGKAAPRAPKDPVALRSRKGDVGGLFNGKIAPLIPYGIRGAIWYQGEANSAGEKARFYQHQLPLLAKDWRGRWGYEFPFAWVQLPNYSSNRGEGWMLVREAALKAVQSVPNSGMAVTLDIGEAKDIHPKNKQEVGRRLALWALAEVYGEGEANLPLPVKHATAGGKLSVTFSGPIQYQPMNGATGLEVAGEDKKWQPADSVEVMDNTVTVSSAAVAKPVAARYAWAEMPAVTLRTPGGVPVTQFRTTDW